MFLFYKVLKVNAKLYKYMNISKLFRVKNNTNMNILILLFGGIILF